MNTSVKTILTTLCIAFALVGCQKDELMNSFNTNSNSGSGSGSASGAQSGQESNQHSAERMLLVLSAPSIYNDYYADSFDDIVDFQVNYANSILGHDNVVILVDADTREYYTGRVPEDILLEANVDDIWMRDFTTVNPADPIQFTYTDASMSLGLSQQVQNSFNGFADENYLDFRTTDYWIDGGNIVDNYAGRIVTTERFMEDNYLTYDQAVDFLMNELGATEVAIVPADDDVLAHADGMVMWVAEDVLLVNDYSDDAAFRAEVIEELQAAFPSVTIIEVPVDYIDNGNGEIASACGININSTLTYNNIYVPTFNMAHEQAALALIEQHTDRNVITVDAQGVCAMGGSVRCLTWQVVGQNAEALIQSAREY